MTMTGGGSSSGGGGAAAAPPPTTILRVKRRRDEPPSLPETLLLNASSLVDTSSANPRCKRSRHSRHRRDDEDLANLLDRSTFMGGGIAGGGGIGIGTTSRSSAAKAASNGTAGAESGGDGNAAAAAPSTATAARFRRVAGGDLAVLATSSALRNKRLRVVDAEVGSGSGRGSGSCGNSSDGSGDADGSSGDGKRAHTNGGGGGGRGRSASDPQHRGKARKRQRLFLNIVTAGDVSADNCDSDRLVNASGVAFWKAVAEQQHRHQKKAPGVSIMDPITRSVDSSLRAVFRHEKKVAQHLAFLQTDPLVLSAAQPGTTKWIDWLNHTSQQSGWSEKSNAASAATTTTGTVLHAAAIFNDLDGARSALQLGVDVAIKDGEEYTALFVADTVGSTGVSKLIESHVELSGGSVGTNGADYAGDDDDDYVFDLYCLTGGCGESKHSPDDWDEWSEQNQNGNSDNGANGDEKSRQKKKSDGASNSGANRNKRDGNGESHYKKSKSQTRSGNDDSTTSSEEELCVEIKGGIGYWNEKGELCLEAEKSVAANAGDDDASFGEGDDHDSNDEGWEGNDYPDDEDDDGRIYSDMDMNVPGGYGDSSDEEGLALYGRSYRNDPIPASARGEWSNVWPSNATDLGAGNDSDDERHNLSGFGMDDPDLGEYDYSGPMGRVTYGENGLYGEGGACAYNPDHGSSYEEE